KPIWVGQLPAWKSIGRETLMHEAERARYIGVRELAVEIRDLRSEQQALIDNSSTRKRWNIEEFFVFDVGFCDLALRTFAHHIQLALEGVFVHLRRTANKNLLNIRLRGASHAADCVAVHWSVTPAENT